MNDYRNLTSTQRELMSKFYSLENTVVVLTKSERDLIWDDFRLRREFPERGLLAKSVALESELNRAVTDGNLIQSAIFSECVYAQTLANMLKLDKVYNYSEDELCIGIEVSTVLKKHGLLPRYVYKGIHSSEMLVQAGGYGGVDCALVSSDGQRIYTIEFKEPGAKTSEPDLPNYGEDGFLKTSQEFEKKNPHFAAMLDEQIKKRLNIWEILGSNVHDFETENVETAVSENYSNKKHADVICVEDSSGFLTMLPANQVGNWATIRGELRSAGRNAYKVWTPKKLEQVIVDLGGSITDGIVSVMLSKLGTSSARGGNSTVNRFKLNSVFFVRPSDITVSGNQAVFSLSSVRQIKPTISAHMFFKGLDINRVRRHYGVDL